MSMRHGRWVSGHTYRELENTPHNVQVLQCEVCNKVSIGWYSDGKDEGQDDC